MSETLRMMQFQVPRGFREAGAPVLVLQLLSVLYLSSLFLRLATSYRQRPAVPLLLRRTTEDIVRCASFEAYYLRYSSNTTGNDE